MKPLDEFYMDEGRQHFDDHYSDEFAKFMKFAPKNVREGFLTHFREVFAAGWTACALSKLKEFLSDQEADNGSI